MAVVPELVDHLGRPIQREVLEERLSEPKIMGVRRPVAEPASRGLTPQRLAMLLREAEDGDPEAYLALAEEMEEKDLHYLSVLGTRKRQVAQLDMTIEAASKDKVDEEIAALAQELIDSGIIDQAMMDILDAVGKGFSCHEIMWKLSASKWTIDCLEYVEPRFIRFDRVTRKIPMLIDDQGVEAPLPPYKFLFAQIKAKSGLPLRSGLARPVAWAYLFKNYSIKDWVEFADNYGQPIRVGKYAPGATNDEKNALMRAVAAIGKDFAAIIPQGMMLELQEVASKGDAGGFFDKMARFFDEQVSKGVLGQTGTADATPGKLGGSQDHTMVREDIERADAKAVETMLNLQLVRPYIDLNKGPQKAYPWLKIGRAEDKDVKLMAEIASIIVPMGARVRVKDLTTAAGFTEPADGDELLQAPRAAAPVQPGALPIPANDPNADPKLRALAHAIGNPNRDAVDRGLDGVMDGWEQDVGPMAAQIARVMQVATSYDDLLRRLTQLWPDLDTAALQARLARVAFSARLGAIAGDGLQPGRDESLN